MNPNTSWLGWPDPSSSSSDVPWTQWAAVIAARRGLAGEQLDAVISAVSALTVSRGSEELLFRIWNVRQSLSSEVDTRRLDSWLLSLGQWREDALRENDRISTVNLPITASTQSCLSRSSVVLWALPSVVLSEASNPWETFAHRSARLVELVRSLTSLWLGQEHHELALNRIGEALWSSVHDQHALLTAWAGAQELEARSERVQDVLASEACRHSLHNAFEAMLQSARESIPAGDDGLAGEFIDALSSAFDWLDSYASFRSLARVVERDGLSQSHSNLEKSLRIAASFLSDSANWFDSWEVHRCGFAGDGETLVGSWFHRGFILRSLAGMDLASDAQLSQLLAEGDRAGIRWFGQSRVIPPDADSLGLALELAAMDGAEVSPARLEGWLEPMLQSLPENGLLQTWFYRDTDGPTLDDSLVFKGNDCRAVRSALVLGLIRLDANRFIELIERNIAHLLDVVETVGDRQRGVFFYPSLYADHIFMKVARAHRAAFPHSEHEARLAIAVRAITGRVRRDQRLDGSWGSPQSTAWGLAILEMGGGDPVDLRRAATFLVESQRPDGSWAAEPLYLMPSKGKAAIWHLGRALTTGICGEALFSIRGIVDDEWSGGE